MSPLASQIFPFTLVCGASAAWRLPSRFRSRRLGPPCRRLLARHGPGLADSLGRSDHGLRRQDPALTQTRQALVNVFCGRLDLSLPGPSGFLVLWREDEPRGFKTGEMKYFRTGRFLDRKRTAILEVALPGRQSWFCVSCPHPSL